MIHSLKRKGKKVMKNPDGEMVTIGRNGLQNQKSVIFLRKKKLKQGIHGSNLSLCNSLEAVLWIWVLELMISEPVP